MNLADPKTYEHNTSEDVCEYIRALENAARAAEDYTKGKCTLVRLNDALGAAEEAAVGLR